MKKISIALLIFLTACQGGKKVRPSSSGGINIIRTSEVKAPLPPPPVPREAKTMNVIPNGNTTKKKSKVIGKNLPTPEPPTVQKNKVEVVIKETENGEAIPIIVTTPLSRFERIDQWIQDHSELLMYYLIILTGVILVWTVRTIDKQKVALRTKMDRTTTKKKRPVKRASKKSTRKPAAKKAVKKVAKKRAPKKKS